MRHQKYPIPGADEEYFKQELAPVTAEIDAVMLRKYLAYAKRNCFPLLTPEAKDALVDYYKKLRSVAYDNQDKPVPVTARQLEALVRLAEASARVRLADTIEMDDATRVIKIVDTCLRQVAYDPKTGNLDIDKIASGTTRASRTLIRDLKNTIREYMDGGVAKIDAVYAKMLSMNYTKEEVEKTIEYLNREGELMTPKKDLVKLI